MPTALSQKYHHCFEQAISSPYWITQIKRTFPHTDSDLASG